MKTIAITAQKGGAGKTTLSRNLAVAAALEGQRVLCIDLDPQQSLRQWWQGRSAEMPAMLNTQPSPKILAAVLGEISDQFDIVFIDTPPAAPAWLGDTLEAADLALIPVRPSPDDLRAVGATISALHIARTPFAFIMSQTPRAKLTEEAARVLAQHGRVAPVNIPQRVVYAETGASGLGVMETSDGKAAQEMAELWTYVKGLLE